MTCLLCQGVDYLDRLQEFYNGGLPMYAHRFLLNFLT